MSQNRPRSHSQGSSPCSHSQPRSHAGKSTGLNRFNVSMASSQSWSENRPSLVASSNSNNDGYNAGDNGNQIAQPDTPHTAPEVLTIQEILQAAAQQGNYIYLSVMHSTDELQGAFSFQNDPTWISRIRPQSEGARALVALMNVNNPDDMSDLKRMMLALQGSDLKTFPVVAVQFSSHIENFLEDRLELVRNVIECGIGEFISHVDDDIFDRIEIALLRIDAERTSQRERMEEATRELEEAQGQIDYLQWQWIPTQLRLTSIPAIDPNLQELPDGSLDQLRFVRRLGNGAFGMVYEARTPSGESFAVKVMRKDNATSIQAVERIYRELQIFSILPNHPHLTQLHLVLHSIDSLYVCLSFGGPQNLYDLQLQRPQQKFTIMIAKELFRQVSEAVGHLHRNLFFHRDIKPENIAVNGSDDTGWRTMLVDCELALSTDRPLRQCCGSLPYTAPETLDVPCQYYGGPADAFALGMSLFGFVRGQQAMENVLGWGTQTDASPLRAMQLRAALHAGPPDSGRQPDEPVELQHLLAGLLHVDPSARMNLGAVARSQWLQDDAADNDDDHGEPVHLQ